MLNAIEWAKKVLKENGSVVTIEPQIVRSMPWSTVIRFQTLQETLYLKFMAKDFSYEPLLLEFLNRLNISSLPALIAININERCFLMNDAGRCLRDMLKESYDFELVGAVLQSYANLQKSCIPLTSSLISMGVMDRRLASLPRLYEAFVLDNKFLLLEGLTTQEIENLQSLRSTMAQLCKRLADCGIPETLEHGDFHDNNALIKNGKITINDFGDAAIAHPFFSIASFLNSAERHHHLNPVDEKYIALRDQYLKEWRDYASNEKMMEAFNIAYLIRPFVWALSFVRIKSCPGIENHPEFKDYLPQNLRIFMNILSEFKIDQIGI